MCTLVQTRQMTLVDNLVIDLHPEDMDLVKDLDECSTSMSEVRGELFDHIMKCQELFQRTLTCFPSSREKKEALQPLNQLKDLMERQLNHERSVNMEVIEDTKPLSYLCPVVEPSDLPDYDDNHISDLGSLHDPDEQVHNYFMSDVSTPGADALLPRDDGPSTATVADDSPNVRHFREGTHTSFITREDTVDVRTRAKADNPYWN